MIKLFLKILLVLLPLLFMLAVYLVFDPFEVVHTYQTHSNDPHINYNWDYNQTETLIRNYAARHYDSFIFGNSRSLSFYCRDWQRYIGSTATLHFAAPAESLYGVYAKFKYLADRKIPIRNCLLIVDTTLLPVTRNGSGLLSVKHPKLSGQSLVDFHMIFFRAFTDIPFFVGYLDYKMTGKVRPVFRRNFAEGIYTDPVTGDKMQLGKDRAIAENSGKYYDDLKAVFYRRDESRKSCSPPALQRVQLQYLEEISQILAANGTKYKVIISPNYDQKYLDREDLAKLRAIFGSANVYDYSGINEFTRDIHNYYENSHFRPQVARQIMSEVYAR